MNHDRCIDIAAVVTILRHQQLKIERLEERLEEEQRGCRDFRIGQSVEWVQRTYAINVMDVYKCPDHILHDCASSSSLQRVAGQGDKHDYKTFLGIMMFTFLRFLGKNMAPGATAFIEAVSAELSHVDEHLADEQV